MKSNKQLYGYLVHSTTLLYFQDTNLYVRSEKCQEDAVVIQNIIERYATDAIGYCAFGLNFNALSEPESEFLKFGQSFFKNSLITSLMDILRNVIPETYNWIKFLESRQKYVKFYYTLKQSDELRKSESSRRNDLLQLMFDFRDECQLKTQKEKNYNGG